MAVFFVKGLDAAEVEVFGGGGDGAGLPLGTAVLRAADGAVGSGGPGDAVAEGVDAAEGGGGAGVLEVELGLGGDGGEGCRGCEE